MFSYRAYGLGICCDFELPEFVAADDGRDVTIRLDAAAPEDSLVDEVSVEFAPEEAVLSFKRAGVFRIRGGREIVISPAAGADLPLVRLYLVGKVFATLLYQRGLLVLHGSAVEVDGIAVCFMGTSYFGKSSLAAAMYRCGHKVVADDVTAVEMRQGPPLALPAFPQLKLDPAVARSIGCAMDTLVPLHQLEPRLGLRVADTFTTEPLPLGLIYLLGSDAAARQPLAPQSVLIELVGNSFPARLQQSGGAAHLFQCSQLARQVPTVRLGRQESRMAPDELSRRVRADLAATLKEPIGKPIGSDQLT